MSRSSILRQLSIADTEKLVRWYAESYSDGWRPVMQSHVDGVSGRYTPVWAAELAIQAVEMVTELDQIKRQRDHSVEDF